MCFFLAKVPSDTQIEELNWVSVEFDAVNKPDVAGRLRNRFELLRGLIPPDLLAGALKADLQIPPD